MYRAQLLRVAVDTKRWATSRYAPNRVVSVGVLAEFERLHLSFLWVNWGYSNRSALVQVHFLYALPFLGASHLCLSMAVLGYLRLFQPICFTSSCARLKE